MRGDISVQHSEYPEKFIDFTRLKLMSIIWGFYTLSYSYLPTKLIYDEPIRQMNALRCAIEGLFLSSLSNRTGMYLCKNWDHEASFSATLQWCGCRLALWNRLSARNLSFRRVVKKANELFVHVWLLHPPARVFCLLLHFLPELERVRNLRDCWWSQFITSLANFVRKEGGGAGRRL